jgi:hypothetical protein
MKGAAVAGMLIVALLVGAGVGYLYGNGNERTVTSVSTSAGPTTIRTSATTLTLTLTSTTVSSHTSISYIVQTTTQTVGGASKWNGLVWLSNESNCAVSTSPPTTWYEVPCFGIDTNPVIFNCAVAAATPQGCTQRINTTGPPPPQPSGPNYFVVTIWYPYINYTVYPGLNCRYSVPSVPTPPGPYGPSYAYCIPINATAFIVAQQAPNPV